MSLSGIPNRLIHSSSPYLLQHAHNPVDWFEWGEEALQRARDEDKPILVSIGYSACHWCHVMERESFENADIAALMNDYLICIKVDREERPDLDHVYMEAVQAMGMQGGWPLNVFLTPDGSPFYGGTYFPPQRWSRLLIELNKAFREKRAEINESAKGLREHLKAINSGQASAGSLSADLSDKMVSKLVGQFDTEFGGMDKAPKFIMPSIWQFLLRYHHLSKNPQALMMVKETLIKVACGGIYDQIGGGFARYSVDNRWFAPHFEKMLYDNAQLISLYTEAYQVTAEPLFKQVVEQTISWLFREMRHPNGGFYSALDADSEGEEGKFYCWTADEFRNVLGDRAEEAIRYFQMTSDGNWEHGKNILLGRSVDQQPEWLNEIYSTLMHTRDQRIRPGLDDKIITSWNALTICALVDAGTAFGREDWITAAVTAYHFLTTQLITDDRLRRSYREKAVQHEGFLDDYAALVLCQWSLYEATFDSKYLEEGIRTTEYVFDAFSAANEIYFQYTSRFAEKLITPTCELFDNVIPSSNAMMCHALVHGAALTGKKEWVERAGQMLEGRAEFMTSSPAYQSAWAMALLLYQNLNTEMVILGEQAIPYRMLLGKNFRPFTVFSGADRLVSTLQSQLPLFLGRFIEENQTKIYVCRNQSCLYPVTSVSEAVRILGEE